MKSVASKSSARKGGGELRIEAMSNSPGYAHYVVLIRNDIRPGTVGIVGPFGDEEAAAEYGADWQDQNGDNPCWLTVPLEDGYVPQVRQP